MLIIISIKIRYWNYHPMLKLQFSASEARDFLYWAQENRNSRSVILVFLPGYFLTAIFTFFSLEESHAVTCRRGNWTVRTSRVVLVSSKKHHVRLGKNFWVLRFFFWNHRLIWIDYDRKKCARLFQQVFVCFFAKINIFGLVLTCNLLLNN